MVKAVLPTLALVLTVLAASPAAQGQRGTPPPPTAQEILDTARKGNPQEAWRLFNGLPAGAPKQRVGIQLAAETREIGRGLDLYDQLTGAGQNADLSLLSMLAVSVAGELSQSTDVETRATACGAALVVVGAHEACLRALETMADGTAGTETQAIAVAALANASFPSYRQQLRGLTMRAPLRLRLAQTMARLPSADRVALVQPLLNDSDVALQYQAVQALGNIPGAEALAALRAFAPPGPLRQVTKVSLARHGDAASLSDLPDMLPNLDGYLKIQAARALADAADLRGRRALVDIGSGPVDLDRIYAAEALAGSDPAAARTIVLANLRGSAAVQPAAIYVAGIVGLGTNRLVYRQLAEGGTGSRAAVVAAVLESVGNGGRPRPSRQP